MPDDDAIGLLSFLLEDEEILRSRLPEGAIDLVSSAEEGPGVRWYRLLGNALWKVFSDNNGVVSPDGRVFDLGSWRGSGGFIAQFLNARLAEAGVVGASSWTGRPLGYLDFYMGLVGGPNELVRPVYVYVFERSKARGCAWRYAPPAIYPVRLDSPEERSGPSSYDPCAAVLDDLRGSEGEARLRARLESATSSAISAKGTTKRTGGPWRGRPRSCGPAATSTARCRPT